MAEINKVKREFTVYKDKLEDQVKKLEAELRDVRRQNIEV